MKDRILYECGGEKKIIVATDVLYSNVRRSLVDLKIFQLTFSSHLGEKANYFIRQVTNWL